MTIGDKRILPWHRNSGAGPSVSGDGMTFREALILSVASGWDWFRNYESTKDSVCDMLDHVDAIIHQEDYDNRMITEEAIARLQAQAEIEALKKDIPRSARGIGFDGESLQ
jgi:hypothetical protein